MTTAVAVRRGYWVPLSEEAKAQLRAMPDSRDRRLFVEGVLAGMNLGPYETTGRTAVVNLSEMRVYVTW